MQRLALGAVKRSLWILLSVGFVLACATPFAAIAALADRNMPRRDAFSLVGLAWFANQIIGYGFLTYPRSWDGFAWGRAIGIAALLAAIAAVAVGRIPRPSPAGAIVAAFLAAFVSYELALHAASFVLRTGADAFSLPIVWRILIALAGSLALHRLGLATELIVGSRNQSGAVAPL
jgi:hypothetical protein